jgi:sugar-specific transcriptional regulator TrmB
VVNTFREALRSGGDKVASSTGAADDVFELLGLTEYEEAALRELLSLGRTSAPNLAEATGIPKARIYGVLESLAEAGYIKIIPERPKQYQPKPPTDVLDRAVENERRAYREYATRIDDLREEFLDAFEPLFEQATDEISPTEELFYVVDVGEPSERETRALYDAADRRVDVVTKSFEYFERVEPAVADALDRGVEMRALLLHPDHLTPENQEIQDGIVDHIRTDHPAIDLRFSEDLLPLRGTIVDPSRDYETGTAVFQVEEQDIPLPMRQAAVTESESLVAAMERYFQLIWAYESAPVE